MWILFCLYLFLGSFRAQSWIGEHRFRCDLHVLSFGPYFFFQSTTVNGHKFSPLFLSQSTEQVAAFCRSLHDMNPSECLSSSPSPDSPYPPPTPPRQLSDADKLRKVICELVETERTYVKVSIVVRRQMVWSVCVRVVHRSVLAPHSIPNPYLSMSQA